MEELLKQELQKGDYKLSENLIVKKEVYKSDPFVFELAVFYLNGVKIAERGLNNGYIAYNKEKVDSLHNEELNDFLVNRKLIQNPLQDEHLVDIRPENTHWSADERKRLYSAIPYDNTIFNVRNAYFTYDWSNCLD